ncbi:hypothetical protein BDP27DRAFT_1407747 [Rhodocollybia butyracea]|uniref:Uncharacterized protein n=1 Tax=Rhodocollybia butyracea TaxID=206335 RepID=A0A9P5PBJ1_9AGAR|nr:hypothetical protein BDP27DRAFT_1407747 [Rhodocollybia butyracea]
MHFKLALVVASLFTLTVAIPHPPGLPGSLGFPGGLLKSRGLRDLLDLPPFPFTHHSARSPSAGQSTETPNGEEGNGCFILEPNEPCPTPNNALCYDGLGIDCDAASPA